MKTITVKVLTPTVPSQSRTIRGGGAASAGAVLLKRTKVLYWENSDMHNGLRLMFTAAEDPFPGSH